MAGWSEEDLALSTFNHGQLEELFQDAMRRVQQSYENPNIDPGKAREISIKLAVKLDETTSVTVMTPVVGVKIPPVTGESSMVSIQRGRTREFVAEQLPIDDNVVNMNKGE